MTDQLEALMALVHREQEREKVAVFLVGQVMTIHQAAAYTRAVHLAGGATNYEMDNEDAERWVRL